MSWGGSRGNSGRKKIAGKQLKLILEEKMLDEINEEFKGNTQSDKLRNCIKYALKAKGKKGTAKDATINEVMKGIKVTDNLEPRKYLERIIIELEKKYPLKQSKKFNELVNFSTNKSENIHNWFYYKEGYSSLLVSKLLEEFGAKEGEFLLDPFSGSGTTLVVGKEQKLKTAGFDVNPIALFTSEVKTRNYSKADLAEISRLAEALKEDDIANVELSFDKPKLDIIDKIFEEDILLKLLKLKSYILSFKGTNKNIYNVLKLSYLQSIENLSKMKKDGNGIKYKKNPVTRDVLVEFKENLKVINSSLNEKSHVFSEGIESKVIADSFINAKDHIKEKVDYVICSPPYANCFDYCAVYKMELWMGSFVKEYSDFKKLRAAAVRSHVNGSLKKDLDHEYDLVNWISSKIELEKLWDKKIPHMVKAYFDDMTKVIENLSYLLKAGGKCAIVVGNSSYKGYVVPTDIILASISEKFGFKVKEINVARSLRTSSQQMKEYSYIKNYLRESVIILEKKEH